MHLAFPSPCLHRIQETRNGWPQGRLVSPLAVRCGCSSPPFFPRDGTCIVPCSSSSTVGTPNISAISEHHRSLPSPTLVLAGSGSGPGSGSYRTAPGSGCTEHLPLPPLLPRGNHPIRAHPSPSPFPFRSHSSILARAVCSNRPVPALLCPLALSLPPLSSPVRPPVYLDLLAITPGLTLCLRPRLPYHTTPPVAVQSFHWISILANLLFCTIACAPK